MPGRAPARRGTRRPRVREPITRSAPAATASSSLTACVASKAWSPVDEHDDVRPLQRADGGQGRRCRNPVAVHGTTRAPAARARTAVVSLEPLSQTTRSSNTADASALRKGQQIAHDHADGVFLVQRRDYACDTHVFCTCRIKPRRTAPVMEQRGLLPPQVVEIEGIRDGAQDGIEIGGVAAVQDAEPVQPQADPAGQVERPAQRDGGRCLHRSLGNGPG